MGPYAREGEAALEATRNWTVMYDLLEEVVAKVHLVHPLKVRAIAEARIKADRIDSRILAHFLRCDLLPTAHVRPPAQRGTQQLLRQRLFLVSLRTMVKNRIHVLMDRQRGLRETARQYSDLFGQAGLAWLRAVALAAPERDLLNRDLRLLDELHARILETDGIVRRLVQGDAAMRLVHTIPGFGLFFAALVVTEIGTITTASPFCGEGHRKVRARLRPRGIRVDKARVLRLMRAAQLLAPTRRRHVHGDRAHGGAVTTAQPDELWGTDATRFWTRRDGSCWFFGAIDHCAEDVVGWHVAKVGDRWAALGPIRQGVQRTHGHYAPKIALGLGLRMDWGPQYTAHQFQGELRWLGIRPSPSYVGEPECNGVMERWIRTLKAEGLYLHDFASLDEARQVIGEFIERYNREWLLERHSYRTPAAIRASFRRQAA